MDFEFQHTHKQNTHKHTTRLLLSNHFHHVILYYLEIASHAMPKSEIFFIQFMPYYRKQNTTNPVESVARDLK